MVVIVSAIQINGEFKVCGVSVLVVAEHLLTLPVSVIERILVMLLKRIRMVGLNRTNDAQCFIIAVVIAMKRIWCNHKEPESAEIINVVSGEEAHGIFTVKLGVGSICNVNTHLDLLITPPV